MICHLFDSWFNGNACIEPYVSILTIIIGIVINIIAFALICEMIMILSRKKVAKRKGEGE